MSNFSGVRSLVNGEREEFEAFNRLPQELRKLLNDCKFKWSAVELERYWQACQEEYIPLREVIKFIAEQEDIVICKTTRSEWGDDYVSIVYGGRLPHQYDLGHMRANHGW